MRPGSSLSSGSAPGFGALPARRPAVNGNPAPNTPAVDPEPKQKPAKKEKTPAKIAESKAKECNSKVADCRQLKGKVDMASDV